MDANSLWLDQSLTVNADTVYSNTVGGDQVLVGKDVEVSLPEIKFLQLDQTAMGDFKISRKNQFEAMDMTIHHIGVDTGLIAMLAEEAQEIEVRWIEQIMKEDGSLTTIGCKAFLNAHPQVAAPPIVIKPGEPVDIEIKYNVSGYKLVRDGEIIWDINRLNQKCIVGKVDYFANLIAMI